MFQERSESDAIHDHALKPLKDIHILPALHNSNAAQRTEGGSPTFWMIKALFCTLIHRSHISNRIDDIMVNLRLDGRSERRFVLVQTFTFSYPALRILFGMHSGGQNCHYDRYRSTHITSVMVYLYSNVSSQSSKEIEQRPPLPCIACALGWPLWPKSLPRRQALQNTRRCHANKNWTP